MINRRMMMKQAVAALSAIGFVCDRTVDSIDQNTELIAIIIPSGCTTQYLKVIVAAFQELDSPAILMTDNDCSTLKCWAKIMFNRGEFSAVARTPEDADRASTMYREAFDSAIRKGLI